MWLFLGDNNLNDDQLPSCLWNLSKLEILSLSNNKLGGNFGISTGFNRLQNLEELDLSGNHIIDDGIIPWIGNQTSLQRIDLSNNSLMDPVPTIGSFCGLMILRELDLSYNTFGGSIPQCLGEMHSLKYLNLGDNEIEGKIPPFYNLTSLQEITLSNNRLNGVTTFSMFANMSGLIYIDLSDNPQLVVEFEYPMWTPSFRLLILNLRNCQVNKHSGGELPSFLATQDQLQYLDLSQSNLSGNIPSWLLYNMSELVLINLRGNSLEGLFPRYSLSNTSTVLSLDISENNIRGILPTNMDALLPALLLLNMSGNALHGNIPFGSGLMLTILDLSRNNLSGKIPQEMLVNNTELEYLALSNNRLEGDLFPGCSNMTSLKYLLLDGNAFQGTILRGLSNITSLIELDIRRNFLFETIPTWLPILENLSVLLLSRNKLFGDIPMELCKMQNLHLLDLSNNNLSGIIPSCLNNITTWKEEQPIESGLNAILPIRFNTIESTTKGITYIYEDLNVISPIRFKIEFTTKGITYSYEGVPLSLMTGIDLSMNQLTGSIPSEMGDLRVLRSFNLSYNHITGPIPKSFQNLKNLMSLDLSHNRLSGRIPGELTQLCGLATFSVAFNNLYGSLPDFKNQFGTFKASSYMGNPSLCGPPLRSCSTDNLSQPDGHKKGGNDGKSRIIDSPILFYGWVIFSYILGFWFSMAVLYFKVSWRIWCFKTMDHCIDWCTSGIFRLSAYLRNR